MYNNALFILFITVALLIVITIYLIMSEKRKRNKKSSSKHSKEIPSSPRPCTSTKSEEVIQVDNYEDETESSSAKSISIQASLSRSSSYCDLEETSNESYLKTLHNTAMEDPNHSQWDPNYTTFSTPTNTPKNRTSTPASLRSRISDLSSRKSDLSWSDRTEQCEYYKYTGKENDEKSDFVRALLRSLHDKDVRDMLEGTLCKPMLKKLQILENEQNDANSKIKELEEANTSLNKRITNLEKELKTVKDKKNGNTKDIVDPLQNQITTMKHATNIAQRMSDQDRRNNVVIHGIAESTGESPKKLTYKINEILKKAKIKIDDKFEATRLGKNNAGKTRPVKVCMKNYWDKRTIYKARTTMKATGNTGIFINEDLPKIQQTLLMNCRKARRDNLLVTCWTDEGIVHIKTANKDDEVIPNTEKLTEVTGYVVSDQ